MSGAFDVIINSGFYGEVDNGIPSPGNGGTISGSLSSGGTAGTVTWTFGLKTDNYTLYALNGTSFPNGYYAANGCSTVRSMNPLTSGVTFTTNQNTETADFTGLNPKKSLPVTVLVSRPEGYYSSYEVITLNNASALSFLPALVCVLISSLLF